MYTSPLKALYHQTFNHNNLFSNIGTLLKMVQYTSSLPLFLFLSLHFLSTSIYYKSFFLAYFLTSPLLLLIVLAYNSTLEFSNVCFCYTITTTNSITKEVLVEALSTHSRLNVATHFTLESCLFLTSQVSSGFGEQ